jgi:hypothetical protein
MTLLKHDQTQPPQWVRLLSWPLAIYIVFVFLSNEQYKLTGDPAAIWLFTTITDWLSLEGYEKPFRLLTAAGEIVSSFLLLLPRTRGYGALIALGIMSGAISILAFSPVGVDPAKDGGQLFKMTCTTWLCAMVLTHLYRDQFTSLNTQIPLVQPASELFHEPS